MLAWCAVLLVLGIMAFMDSLFNYGQIFRQVNSVIFMLIALGLLVRTTSMAKLGTREKSQQQIAELEMEARRLRAEQNQRVLTREPQ